MNKYTFNMKKTILTILCLIGALSINAQEPDEVIADEASTDTTEMPDEDVPMDPIYKYRVYLSDKTTQYPVQKNSCQPDLSNADASKV